MDPAKECPESNSCVIEQRNLDDRAAQLAVAIAVVFASLCEGSSGAGRDVDAGADRKFRSRHA